MSTHQPETRGPARPTEVGEEIPTPGRPVRLVPTPDGFWRVVGGVAVAMLAPFFGILIGSTRGDSEVTSRMDPLYWGFFIGCVVGALGLVSLGLGVRTLLRSPRDADREPEPEAAP